MENAIVPQEVTEIRHATPDEIYDLNERIMDTTSEVAHANEALDLLAESLYDLHKSVEQYNEKKRSVRSQMQSLNSIM